MYIKIIHSLRNFSPNAWMCPRWLHLTLYFSWPRRSLVLISLPVSNTKTGERPVNKKMKGFKQLLCITFYYKVDLNVIIFMAHLFVEKTQNSIPSIYCLFTLFNFRHFGVDFSKYFSNIHLPYKYTDGYKIHVIRWAY